jgi:hypothetical protein
MFKKIILTFSVLSLNLPAWGQACFSGNAAARKAAFMQTCTGTPTDNNNKILASIFKSQNVAIQPRNATTCDNVWTRFTQGKQISILGSDITDLGFLNLFTETQYLIIDKNIVRDVSVVGCLTNLVELNLSRIPPIQDFSFLAGLTKLKSLSLIGMELTYLPSLPENIQRSIVSYELTGNKITNAGMYNYDKLEDINLSSNRLGYADFSYVPLLKQVNVSHNQLRNFPAISPSVETVDASSNLIYDMGQVSSFTGLKSINVRYNELASLGTIADLPNLKIIDFYMNKMCGFQSLERLFTRFTVLYTYEQPVKLGGMHITQQDPSMYMSSGSGQYYKLFLPNQEQTPVESPRLEITSRQRIESTAAVKQPTEFWGSLASVPVYFKIKATRPVSKILIKPDYPTIVGTEVFQSAEMFLGAESERTLKYTTNEIEVWMDVGFNKKVRLPVEVDASGKTLTFADDVSVLAPEILVQQPFTSRVMTFKNNSRSNTFVVDQFLIQPNLSGCY